MGPGSWSLLVLTACDVESVPLSDQPITGGTSELRESVRSAVDGSLGSTPPLPCACRAGGDRRTRGGAHRCSSETERWSEAVASMCEHGPYWAAGALRDACSDPDWMEPDPEFIDAVAVG